MCGIIGYIGKRDALPVLLDGLERMEYRGYDSAGVVVLDGGEAHLAKTTERIAELKKDVEGKDFSGNIGIAHTRWATHGKPTKVNAHPHTGCNKEFFIVHNGIIENYEELKVELKKSGHKFSSHTDSEVIAHLIEEEFKHYHNFEAAFKAAVSKLKGAYGLAAVYKNDPEKVLIARRSSPIVIGVGDGEHIIASDVSAILKYTKDIIYLLDDEIAVCESDNLRVSNFKDEVIGKKAKRVDVSIEQAEKGNFETFMKKEMSEIPEVIRNAIRGRIVMSEAMPKFGCIDQKEEEFKKIKRIVIVACGTSYYSGLLARSWFSDMTSIPTVVERGSEFKINKSFSAKDTLVIAISQSGETADTLSALKATKKEGALTLGVVNLVGSSIAREADLGIYNHAGPEISVASTKAFISQSVVLALLVIYFARKESMGKKEGELLLKHIQGLYKKAGQVLGEQKTIKRIAKKYSKYKDFMYLGRGYNHPIALEGALKLKEISYIHAEAYASGELKHGPLALIDSKFPSFFIATKGPDYNKTISNIQELKARNGKVICIATKGDRKIEKIADDVIFIPRSSEMLSPILAVIVEQLFAYFVAHDLGKDIDKPRNLAKSVTVE